MWSAKRYFAGHFIPAKPGVNKWWFLVGGKSSSSKLQSIDVDGCPTRAVRVTGRWRKILEKSYTPVIAYAYLKQHLEDTLIREAFFEVWSANKLRENRRDFNRAKSQKRYVSYANPFRTPSIRSCASRSII